MLKKIKCLLNNTFIKDGKPKPFECSVAIGIFIVSGYVSGLMSMIDTAKISLIEILNLPFWRYYVSALFTFSGLKYMLFFLLISVGFFYYIKSLNGELDQIKSTDDRGVNYGIKGTYGTAEMLTRAEAAKVFEINPIFKATGTILGQYTEAGKETICLPQDTQRNRNILILGSPGTGKSFSYVQNAIFQSIVRGESVVTTDPKGELYEATADILRKAGYIVKVFNLENPLRSDAWDCAGEIYDPETMNVSELRVAEFADTLMKNTLDGPDDHFWGMGEQNLLKAAISFCGWVREVSINEKYEEQANLLMADVEAVISYKEANSLRAIISSASTQITMKEKDKALRLMIKIARGADFVEPFMTDLMKQVPLANITSIYHMLVTTDLAALEGKFKCVPASHPAAIAWSIFRGGGENVKPGFVMGLTQRLQLFQMRDIRRITANKDICFEDIGTHKTALFCVISDKSTAMRAISSLFFTFLFKDLSDAADRYGPKTRLSVNVIADEFANIGAIPNFQPIISTVRSRRINISIILQNVMQLEKVYEKTGKEMIISCCDTILFLGCNDDTTAKFISDLSGVSSIKVTSIADSKLTSFGNRGMMQGYKSSEGDGKRNLFNPDEVRRLPREDVLIYHNGCNILRAHRCGYIEHPFYKNKNWQEMHLRDYPLASDKYKDYEALDAFFRKEGNEQEIHSKDCSLANEKYKSYKTLDAITLADTYMTKETNVAIARRETANSKTKSKGSSNKSQEPTIIGEFDF